MLEAERVERHAAAPASASSPIKRTLARPAATAVTTERGRAGATLPTKKVSSRPVVRPASSPIKSTRPTSPVEPASSITATDADTLAAERGDGLRRKLSGTSARAPSTLPKSPVPPPSIRRETTRPALKREMSDEDDSMRSSPSFDSLLPPVSPAYKVTSTSPAAPTSARRPLAARRVSQDQSSPSALASSDYRHARSPSISPTLARATLAPSRERLPAHTPTRLRPGLAPGSLRPSPGSASRGIFRHESESEEEHGVSCDDGKYLTPGPGKTNRLGLQMGSEDENEAPRYVASARRVRAPLGSAKEARGPLDAAPNVAPAHEPTTSLAAIEAGLAKLAMPRHRRTSSALGDQSSPEDKKLDLPRLPRDVLAPPAPREGSPTKRTLGGGSRTDRERSSSPIKPASSSIFAPRYPTSAVLRTKVMPDREAPASPVRRPSCDRAAPSRRQEEHEETMAQATAEAEARRMAADVVARVRQGRRKSLAAIRPLGLPDAEAAMEEPSKHVEFEERLISGERTPETPEERAARRAAKHQRRKSLYTYVPTKRDDMLSDASPASISTMSTTSKSPVVTPPTRFLRGLRILVDVRDQDGEDASSAWVTMLKEWGARVFLRPPTLTPDGASTLSHIVYKGGRPSTLHAFRSAPEPKPLLVGVSWVLRMLQEGKRTDETAYLVELGKEAVFRKVSMMPKRSCVQFG